MEERCTKTWRDNTNTECRTAALMQRVLVVLVPIEAYLPSMQAAFAVGYGSPSPWNIVPLDIHNTRVGPLCVSEVTLPRSGYASSLTSLPFMRGYATTPPELPD